MKTYIAETFRFNDAANKLVLAKIREIPENGECIRYFSHLINSMNKWMARIKQSSGYVDLDWWLPEYRLDELEAKWNACLDIWLDYINRLSEEQLLVEVEFVGFDGGTFAATPKDIALQLNYHSIHHRAQIVYLIRQQGIAPDFIDYIGTRYRKIS
ncbi:hypothetical protein BH10ACI3_BH10ACI3_02100 [soil metagenome]